MGRKKSLLGQCHRKSAPVPTRQLRLFASDSSPTRSSSNRSSRSRVKRSRAISMGRVVRPLSADSEVRMPFRRSRSAFATPNTPVWEEQLVMSTQRRQVGTPMSSAGSIQPWLSTAKKIGKGMKAHNEKYEQAAMVVKIQEYFVRQDLGMNLIPMSGLQQRIMTLNLFVSLASHLLADYYPRHVITMSNYTETIPQMVKSLGYSGNVTKSWLRTANNSHSWPHVLKLLSWLVTLVEMKDKVVSEAFSKMEEEVDDENPVSSKELLDYFLSTYVSWDQEQMDDIEVFTSQLEEKFNVGLCSEEEFEALSVEVEQIQKRLEQDSQECEEESFFKKIKAEHDEVQEEFVKLSSQVSAQEETFNNMQQKLFDLSLQKEELEKELQMKHKLLQQKQTQVSTQKVSMEEKLLIDEKMRSLQVDIHNLEAIKSKHMEDICRKDMEISQFLRNISEEKEKFYKKLQDFDDPRLQELLQNRSGATHDDICRVLDDIASKSKNKILMLKKTLPGKSSHLDEKKQQLKNTTAELEAERAKVKSLHVNLEKHEQIFKQREAEHMFESQQIQNKLKRVKSNNAHVEELEEVRAKLEKETKEFEELREYRANNARTWLEVMTQVYADFEKFRAKILVNDELKQTFENHPTPLPPHGVKEMKLGCVSG